MLELNEETRFILGRPNFACAGTASLLRVLGHEIETKAEEEQAAAIHWMLCLYEKHGSKWKEKANEILKTADKQRIEGKA